MVKTILKIAVCDDDQDERDTLLAWIPTIDVPANCLVSAAGFSSGSELAAAYRAGRSFDIIFLDMLMPVLDGIQTARFIRELDDKALIIFFTSSPDFAIQSYHVDAFDYLLKTGDKNRMESVLKRAVAFVARREGRRLQIRSGSSVHSVKCDAIEYIEIYAKKLSYHLIPGQTLETYKPIRDLEAEIAGEMQFFKIHRSIIVNLAHVTHINPSYVMTVSSQKLPVARGKYADLERAFLFYTAQHA